MFDAACLNITPDSSGQGVSPLSSFPDEIQPLLGKWARHQGSQDLFSSPRALLGAICGHVPSFLCPYIREPDVPTVTGWVAWAAPERLLSSE